MVTGSSFTFLCCLTVLFEGNLCDLNLIAFCNFITGYIHLAIIMCKQLEKKMKKSSKSLFL